MSVSRRETLFAGLALSACGGVTMEVVDAGTRPSGDGWTELSLSEFPALAEPGGSAVVTKPDALIDVWVLHRADDSFAAVWRVCTHGACDVEVRAGEQFECPCHGSVFAVDGSVVRGPASRPLRRFEAVRAGSSLFLRRI